MPGATNLQISVLHCVLGSVNIPVSERLMKKEVVISLFVALPYSFKKYGHGSADSRVVVFNCTRVSFVTMTNNF